MTYKQLCSILPAVIRRHHDPWPCDCVGPVTWETPAVFIAVTHSIVFKLSSRSGYDAIYFSVWGLVL